MNIKNIDTKKIAHVALEINDRVKLITRIFAKDKKLEPLLRNLAAASIHMAFFMRDIYDHIEGNETVKIDNEDQFLNECGCKDE